MRKTHSPASEPSVPPGTVVVAEAGDGLAQYLLDGRHHLLPDEPGNAGGNDRGPHPYELLLMALGACTSITVRLYAGRHNWPLERVIVRLKHSRDHAADCADCDKTPRKLERVDRDIELRGDLSAEQKARLLQIANQCPVHRTLTTGLAIESRLVTFEEDDRMKLDALLDEALAETFPASDPTAVSPRR